MSLHQRLFFVNWYFFSLVFCLTPIATPIVTANDTTPLTLDPIIVTGSAYPTRLSRTTQSHTVITHSNSSALQPNRLTSLLQQVPGFHLDEMGGRGGISSVYLRGADPNFTLIMLDGIPMNDSTDQRGGSVDLSTISIDQISKVEIVRGPLSAFYGSEAVAGAINLITKPSAENTEFRILMEGGRFDSRKGLIQAQGSTGPLSANFSLSHTRNDAQVEKDAFSQHAIGWNLGIEPDGNWDIRLTGNYTHSSIRNFPEGSGGPTFALLRETEKRETRTILTGLTASLETPAEWHHQIFLSLSHRSQDVDNPGVLSTSGFFQIPPTRFITDYERYQARLTETWAMTPHINFSFGGQITYENGNRHGTQDLGSFGGSSIEPLNFSLDRTVGGTFAELSATPWSSFLLNIGARLDLTDQSQPRLSPRISARYELLPLLHLRGAYGKGFKLPGLASLGDPLIGNPSLKPESSTGWDLGIHIHTPHNEFTTSVTYFHNRFHGLIDLDPDLLAQNRFQLTNLDSAVAKGVEFSGQLSPQAPISFQVNLTYLTTRVFKTWGTLRNRPTWRGGLGFTILVVPTITLNSRVTYVSSRLDFQVPTQMSRVGSYTKVDTTLTFRPLPNWQWYATLENLTNASYENFRGFSSPPLSFRIGITYSHSPSNQ